MKIIKIIAKKNLKDAGIEKAALEARGFNVQGPDGPFKSAIWNGTELEGCADDLVNDPDGIYIVIGTKD
jgi:hypothetical protein